MQQIDYNFTSKINELEDIFLGHQVGYDVFVSRIFEEVIPSSEADYESTFKESYRLEKLPDYDYMEDVENDYYITKINYDEIDYNYWDEILNHYYYRTSSDTFNEIFKVIDKYLADSSIDLPTKTFSFEKLLREVITCQYELEWQLKGTRVDGTSVIENRHQQILVETFITLYKAFAKRMLHPKYTSFLKNKIEIPSEELPNQEPSKAKEQEPLPPIEATPCYQKLSEINFIDDIKSKYPSKYKEIIATLGRKHYSGIDIIRNKKVYYAFCNKVGVIQKLEEKGFYKNKEIAGFLVELGDFTENSALNTFEKYYQARHCTDRPNVHFPFTQKTEDELQCFFKYKLEIPYE